MAKYKIKIYKIKIYTRNLDQGEKLRKDQIKGYMKMHGIGQ